MWITRLLFAYLYVPLNEFDHYKECLPLAIFNALRFDFQTVAYILLIPTIVFLLALVIKKEAGDTLLRRFSIPYFVVANVTITVLGIIDLSFYRNFHSHINITIFDFFNEGPWGLLKTIWLE